MAPTGARGSRRYIKIAVEASLRRLQTDWIDLYQLHVPDLLKSTNWQAMERYQQFGNHRNLTMLEATFGWFLAQPNLSSVISGATTPEQVRHNVAASSAWVPHADALTEIDTIFV